MDSVRELNQEEYEKYEEWAYLNENELDFNFEVQYHEAGHIYIKIFEADDKVIGLVYTYSGRNGWEFHGDSRLELAYDVVANHENEYVRSAIASFWLPGSFEIASYKRNGPAPYRILKRLAKDESAIVRTSVTWSNGVTREILDMLARDSEEMVREAVACDPLTPPTTLDMMSNDESLAVLENLAANPSIPTSTIARISTVNSRVLRNNLAENPATPPTILWNLLDEASDGWDGWAIRERIAGNPNAPSDLLLKIAPLHVGHVWENLAKNPNTPQEAIIMIAEREAGTRCSQPEWPKALLDNPLLPPSYFEKFADTTSTTIRRLVRDHPRTPESLKLRLSYAPDLAKGELYYPEPKKPRFPETGEPTSIIEIYSLSQNGSDRALAAGAPNVPYRILERLAVDYSAAVRTAVAGNKYAGEDLLLMLCADVDEKVRMAVAANPNLTPSIIEKLQSDESENVRAQLAKRADISPEALAKFAASDSVALRYAAAGNESLPHDIAMSLIGDQSTWVRKKIALRADLDKQDCMIFMNNELGHCENDGDGNGRAARRPNTEIVKILMDKIDMTEALQEELSHIGDRDIKSSLARRPDAPLPVVIRLAEDSDYLVRRASADSSLLPEETARKLAKDKEVVVRIALSENPHVSQAILRELADDEYEYVRRGAIQNPSIEETLLLERVQSDIEWERSSAASNPMLPYSVLETLSRDDSVFVRGAVASSPNLSVQNLVRLSEDPSDRVRASVARNRNLPVETMVRLAGDESTRVTESLMSREDLTEDVLHSLVHKRPIYAISLYLRYGKTFGADLSEALENIEDTRILIKLAECEDLPEAIMLRLFEFDDNRIRASLINNPNMPYVTVEPEPEADSFFGYGSVYDEDIPF